MQAERISGEISWGDIIRMLIAVRWIVLIILGACVAAAVAYLQLATPIYAAQVSVVPVESQRSSGVLSQVVGLGNLVGLNLGGGNSTTEALAVLRSRDLLRQYIEQHDLIPILFAKKWDGAAKRWKDSDADRIPDARDAVSRFANDIRSVDEDKKSGLVILSIRWHEPHRAAEWASGLIELANDRLQKRALDQSERNIETLRSALKATEIPAVQQAIGRVLESELQKDLVARGQSEFAFRIVDDAEVPKRPVSPRPVLVALIALFAAAIISLSYAMVARISRSES